LLIAATAAPQLVLAILAFRWSQKVRSLLILGYKAGRDEASNDALQDDVT